MSESRSFASRERESQTEDCLLKALRDGLRLHLFRSSRNEKEIVNLTVSGITPWTLKLFPMNRFYTLSGSYMMDIYYLSKRIISSYNINSCFPFLGILTADYYFLSYAVTFQRSIGYKLSIVLILWTSSLNRSL